MDTHPGRLPSVPVKVSVPLVAAACQRTGCALPAQGCCSLGLLQGAASILLLPSVEEGLLADGEARGLNEQCLEIALSTCWT